MPKENNEFLLQIKQTKKDLQTLRLETSKDLTENDLFELFVMAFVNLRYRDEAIMKNLIFAAISSYADTPMIVGELQKALNTITAANSQELEKIQSNLRKGE